LSFGSMTGLVAFRSVISREFPAVVFVNPLAGGGRTGLHLLGVRQVFEREKIDAEFVITESSEDLELRARLAISGGRPLLLAMGGDGTFQGLVNAAFGSDVLLGVLPTGGGNDFAAALGLPKDPVAAAQAVLGGQPRSVDLLRARTEDGRDRLYAGGGGVGLDAEAAPHAAGKYRRVPGRLRYIVSALRALPGFTRLGVRAEFPGSELPPMEARALLAGVLNTPTCGAGLRLAPEARMDDGWLNTVFLKEMNALEVLALVPRLLWSGDLPSSRVKRARARKVRLLTDRPCFFQGDGEIFGPAPVEIEVMPRAARVLAPARR
jgi:diacylglycerol kinase (ATP)